MLTVTEIKDVFKYGRQLPPNTVSSSSDFLCEYITENISVGSVNNSSDIMPSNCKKTCAKSSNPCGSRQCHNYEAAVQCLENCVTGCKNQVHILYILFSSYNNLNKIYRDIVQLLM